MLQPLLFSTGWPGTLSVRAPVPCLERASTLLVSDQHSILNDRAPYVFERQHLICSGSALYLFAPSTLFGTNRAPYLFAPSVVIYSQTPDVGDPTPTPAG